MSSNTLLSPTPPSGSLDSGLHHVYWKNINGTATSIALANLAEGIDKPILVVCENNETVAQLKRELLYFSRLPAASYELANPGAASTSDGTGATTTEYAFPVLTLPDWETLPYDNFSPHQDIISDRLRALFALPSMAKGILLISMASLMHRLPPKGYVSGNSLLLRVGDTLDISSKRKELIGAAYQQVETVNEHGEFTIRGSIIDLFPMGSPVPYRIDLMDDEIESLRSFDPESQRTLNKVDEINLLPGKEFPLHSAGITHFRSRFQERFDIDLRQCPLYQDISDGISSPGVEYYLGLFFDDLSSLLDFLPENSLLCRIGDLHKAGSTFWGDVKTRYEDRQIDRFRPVLSPGEVFFTAEEILGSLKNYPSVSIQTDDKNKASSFGLRTLPDLDSNPKLQKPFQALEVFINEQTSQYQQRVLFCAESAGRKETLLEILKNVNIHPHELNHWSEFQDAAPAICICVAPLDQGLWLESDGIILITESQLFGNRIAQRRRRGQQRSNADFILRSLSELHIGDAVVHVDHGVGRYRGLQNLSIEGQETEFISLEYAGESKLYVPVSSLHLVSRYSGSDPESAPLTHLGTEQWQKTKRKAAEKIRDVAAELLEIYAQREAKQGFQYQCKSEDYTKFSASFPFEETLDQENAISAVLTDMASKRAMDRLVCGDVGFGKTEVAMRAAFIAVQNGKQVAILVPTTLLAQQHFENFRDRFADWPFAVDVISRFKSVKEQELCLERVKAGKIDILVGTHKLLSNEIDYSNLGLLIIDEEHRFGVRQKEKLKALRSEVDILTLTATPIPRTLNMALSNIRDLSLITTAPAKRLSVKTFVREHQDSLVREAVLRELLRGGQVFYVHNEVKSIQRTAEHLAEILPQARICVGHGQMPERELEKVMSDFYHKRYNLLLCTTIIETGIDIPSANTIIINRADKFGLAQLHQLRGRVGRSHHQAYAYMLMPPQSKLGADAQKRIEAIQAASTLGAGFTLASHDLEIRGAGELLGDEQSGHMQKIGFSLYTEMLEEAVDAIKAGRSPALDFSPDKAIEVNLRIPALIPDEYLPDVHTRLIMYKRISAATDQEELSDLMAEMIDRFGKLPPSSKLLFQQTALKLEAMAYGIKKIDANVTSGRIEFGANTRVDPMSLVQLLQKQPNRFKLRDASHLHFSHDAENPEEKIESIRGVLELLEINEAKAA